MSFQNGIDSSRMRKAGTFWGIVIIKLMCFVTGYSQNIELKFTELIDNKVVLHYNLVDSVAGRFFTIRLYHSKDNFLNPLEKISGDIGFEVKPGPNKRIVWDAKAELGDAFEGGISLEIRGRVFLPFINLEQFNQFKSFKRKREYNMTWSGGKPTNILNFDLIKDDKKVLTFPNVANVGHYKFQFPPFVKPGKNYQFRVTDTKNKDESVHSTKFSIRRKTPLVLKVLALGVFGAAVYFLLPQTPEDKTLPSAPVHP